MKATLVWSGVLLLTAVAASQIHAGQPAWYPGWPYARLQAPDACGPGSYNCCPYGTCYGPNYYLTPPFPPMTPALPRMGPKGQPMMGNGQGGAPPPVFPSHPFARGPRDYFMID
jgi:hypothetical protein